MKALPPFYLMLEKAAAFEPLFVTVPDVPYDGAATQILSLKHRRIIRARWPHLQLAIAVQDGMNPDDLEGFDWCFVGGSTDWKWATAASWVAEAHARGMGAHIARVNTASRIRRCQDIGADSADGTGIWRGDQHQLRTVLDALVQPGLW